MFYDDLLVAKDHIASGVAGRLAAAAEGPEPADDARRPATSAHDLETPLDEALERCVKNLGDLERLVRPAATRLDFLDDKDWRTARELLADDQRGAGRTDPDRALPSWMGPLVDRDAADDLDLAELLALTRARPARDSADLPHRWWTRAARAGLQDEAGNTW